MTTAREQLTSLLNQLIKHTDSVYPTRNEMARMFAPDLVDNMMQESRLRELVLAENFRDAPNFWDSAGEDDDPEDLLINSVDEIVCRLEGWDHAWIANICAPVAYPDVEYSIVENSPPFRSAAEAATWAVERIRRAHKINPDLFYQLKHTDEDAEVFEILLDSRRAQVD